LSLRDTPLIKILSNLSLRKREANGDYKGEEEWDNKEEGERKKIIICFY
jgi:hypothetical protein